MSTRLRDRFDTFTLALGALGAGIVVWLKVEGWL
jgi:hypothetical protein